MTCSAHTDRHIMDGVKETASVMHQSDSDCKKTGAMDMLYKFGERDHYLICSNIFVLHAAVTKMKYRFTYRNSSKCSELIAVLNRP